MVFNWASFLIYAVVTAATPGPNNIMSMSNGCRSGFVGALPFNFGIGAGFSVVMLLCTALCDAMSSLIPAIETPMLVVGAAYMLHLAWGTFRGDGGVAEADARSGFLSGLLLQFVNPKIYVYCIVSMEAYVLSLYHGDAAPLVGFALLLAFIGFVFTLCWSAFGAAFARLFTEHAKAVNAVMAVLLAYCAVSLFLP